MDHGLGEEAWPTQRALTFVASDPPRRSVFAAWDPDAPGGLIADREAGATTFAPIDVDVVLPRARGVGRSTVSGLAVPMATAIERLASLPHAAPASPSAHAWAGVVRCALSLIADGRVLPWVSPDGWDTWRLDPVDAADHEVLTALAAALPAEAHATPVDGRGRISDPLFAVRAVGDAVADAFIRTPAAHRVGSLRVFADPSATRVPHLRPWVQDLAATHCSTARLVLRMVPPADTDDEPEGDDAFSETDRSLPDEGTEGTEGTVGTASVWTIRFQLQSRVDPSLVVDAADYWSSPAAVLDRFGAQAETVLLAGLRTVAALVEPLADVLDELAPASALIADDHIDHLLDALDPLTEADIDVRWPSELVAPRIDRRLVVSAGSPPTGMAPLLQLDGLLDVDWEFLLDGTRLTAEELRVLSGAKRSVVSLRGRWVRLDPATVDKLKAPPPKLSPTTALALALGADVDLPDTDVEPDETIEVRVAGSFDDLVAKVHALAGDREQAEPDKLCAELRAYQRRGLAWMSDLVALGFGGCLADDMGLGKTIQVLSLHAHLRGSLPADAADDIGPTLVVCPTSLINNWKREAATFLPDTPVRVFHGSSRHLDELEPDSIVLTSYGVVRSDAGRLDEVGWSLVVADEAQQAKNPRSRTARALREIRSGVRLALTGTPVENKLSELWSVFDWAVPGLLGPLETFRRTTALPIERDNDRAATDRLQRLLRPFLLRRHKTDPGIAPELPDKIERDVVVPLSSEQVTLYKATVDASLTEVAEAEGIERRGLVLKLLTGLKQITNHPAQFLGEDGPLPARSGKLDALDELAATIVGGAEQGLLFTQYVAMGKLLVEQLGRNGHRVAMLHGALGLTARQALVDRFQDGELDFLVLSLKAGGTGLNLTRATHVIHYDRWWNPAVEDQATDRAYRIGQDRTVTVHRLITQGTVEDRVAALLDAKRALAASVTGGGESWIGELDDDELAELVVLTDAIAEAA
ncbi:MAG: DEAD/DEAH box helicase [Actinomycetota bacterium]